MPTDDDLPKRVDNVFITYNRGDSEQLYAIFTHKDGRWFRIPIVDEDGMEDYTRELAVNFERNYRGFVEQHLED